MTGNREHDFEGGTPDEILAGEYALGLLDAGERAKVESRATTDTEFAALLIFWQREFSEFDEAYEQVTPPRHLFSVVENRLFGTKKAVSFWSNLAFWRVLALGTGTALALTVLVFTSDMMIAPETQMVASLKSEQGEINTVILYGSGSATLRMTVLSPVAGDGKDAELWLVRGTEPPISLGILPKSGRLERPLPTGIQALIAPGDVLAISIEPEGGSPTGQVTGPIVATGLLTEI